MGAPGRRVGLAAPTGLPGPPGANQPGRAGTPVRLEDAAAGAGAGAAPIAPCTINSVLSHEDSLSCQLTGLRIYSLRHGKLTLHPLLPRHKPDWWHGCCKIYFLSYLHICPAERMLCSCICMFYMLHMMCCFGSAMVIVFQMQ